MAATHHLLPRRKETVVGRRARHLLSYTRQTKYLNRVGYQSSLFEQLEGGEDAGASI